jgi:peptide deformylase
MDFLENYNLSGEELKIFKYPNPILNQVAQEVTVFDEHVITLVKNMLYTMYMAPGIGLAAPQVGKSLRIFVMDVDYEREKITLPDGQEDYTLKNFNPKVFINPVFSNQKGEVLYEEGCLSLPGIFEKVKRWEQVNVTYQDLTGETKQLEAQGLLSICLQHENDHLDGIVFIERLSLLKKKLLSKKFLKSQLIRS